MRVVGTLDVERLLIAEYNHGSLITDGLATVPLLLNLDFDVTLRGGLVGEHVESDESAQCYLPAQQLWEAAAADGS